MIKSLYYLTEPLHDNTYWCQLMVDAIMRRAAYRRMQLNKLSADSLDRVPPSCSPVIVIGATESWQEQVAERILESNLRGVMLSTHAQGISEHISVITLNQSSMAEYAVHYFYQTKHRRIAYLGCNFRSVNDHAKLEALRATCARYGMEFGESDVFPFDGDIEKCVGSFIARCEPYDAVLCANDVSGVLLMKNQELMRRKRIPEDMYVISYGNTLLSKLIQPTLTSITLDYEQVGTSAVDTAIYLRKNPAISAQCTIVKAQMVLGASTHFERVDSLPLPLRRAGALPDYPGFYRDPLTKEILGVEEMLNHLDKTGLYLVLALLRGYKKAQILDRLYIADSTYKYRLHKICQQAGVKSKEELLTLLRRWVDPERLDDYLSRLSMITGDEKEE